MIVISTTDLSNYNSKNSKSVTLIEEFGLYIVIVTERKFGFFGYGCANVIGNYTDYERAFDCYIKNGGVMRREF